MSVLGFPMSLFDRLAFSIPAFSVTPVSTRTSRILEVALILSNIQNVVTNFSCWQCLCTRLGPISLLYKQLSQYTLLTSFTLLSALLTKFAKKFQTKLLASVFRFHKIVHENTFVLTLPCFIWISRAIAKRARIVLTAFCQCSSFVVNGITEI